MLIWLARINDSAASMSLWLTSLSNRSLATAYKDKWISQTYLMLHVEVKSSRCEYIGNTHAV